MKVNVKESLEFINKNRAYIQIAADLFQIYNRNIMPHLLKRLERDLQGEASRFEAKSRLSPINILPKIVNKLSNVYRTTVERRAVSGLNEVTLNNVYTDWQINPALHLANRMLNLHRCVALEPVVSSKRVRVIPAHKFLVRSDGTIDNVMIEFIKIIGNETAATGAVTTIYQSYTDEEFVTYDSDGNVMERIPNEFGIIPITYFTRDCVTLQPEEDSDTLALVTLLPVLLSDMNFALKFQCFSIIYAMNIESKNMQLAPNAVWFFQSKNDDKAELGMLKPTVSIDEMLKAIESQYALWLESRGLKMSSFASTSMENMSGIAKAIDAADITDDIAYQREIFAAAEPDLIKNIGLLLGNQWESACSFQETTILPETPTEKVNRIVVKKNEKLMSWNAAIREANSHMSEEEIEKMKLEILAEEHIDGIRNGNEPSDQSEESASEELSGTDRQGSTEDNSDENGGRD